MKHAALAPGLSRRSAPGLRSAGNLCIAFGAAAVELVTDDAAWADELRRHYAGFETTAEPSVVVVHDGEHPGFELPTGVMGDGDNGHRRWWARVDLHRRAADIAGPASRERFEAVVRDVLPSLLPGSALVHAAALASGGRGYLCCGRSGAGKSTIAGLLGDRALCDEQALLSRDGDRFTITSLPFSSARPGCADLQGVYILCHGNVHRRRELGPTVGLRCLGRHVRWPTRDPAAMEHTFALLAAVAEKIPVWKLHFRPDAGVWSVIDGRETGG